MADAILGYMSLLLISKINSLVVPSSFYYYTGESDPEHTSKKVICNLFHL